MKAMKIMGFLAAMFVVSNMQSMESPIDYSLEAELLNGNISYGEYLEILEETSEEYGSMLKNLRIAEYDNNNIYLDFIDKMDEQLQPVQAKLMTWDPLEHNGKTKEEVFELLLENLYRQRSLIGELYGNLVRLIENDRAAITQTTGSMNNQWSSGNTGGH